jgi:hypothetical protein
MFIGETVDSDGNALVSTAATTAAELDAAAKIRSELLELPKEDSALDLKIPNPNFASRIRTYFSGSRIHTGILVPGSIPIFGCRIHT